MTTVGHTITLGNTIGHGSCGTVRSCVDNEGNSFAVKCIDLDNERGLPNILEASIMSTILHKNINKAVRIHTDNSKLYIIQELATTDLLKRVRSSKSSEPISLTKLRDWFYGLSQAVACLHREDTIHGDIKAANALIFDDDSIKLTDFNLAIKKWSPNDRFSHRVGTATHRALECFLGKEWEFPLDIWALGCTFYEVTYGELLFPYQGPSQDEKRQPNISDIVLQRNINCLLDWGNRNPYIRRAENSHAVFNEKIKPEVKFSPFVLPSAWNKSTHSVLNNLILKMLQIDPNQRPTIFEILKHPFFENLTPSPYSIISTPVNSISHSKMVKAKTIFERSSTDPEAKRLALEIYSRSNGIENITDTMKSYGSLWIASKVVRTGSPKYSIPKGTLFDVERIICQHLLFRLHIPARNDLRINNPS
jgi:serine/threonine protein kinase